MREGGQEERGVRRRGRKVRPKVRLEELTVHFYTSLLRNAWLLFVLTSYCEWSIGTT